MNTFNNLELLIANKVLIPQILEKFKNEKISASVFFQFIEDLNWNDILSIQKTFKHQIWEDVLTPTQLERLVKKIFKKVSLNSVKNCTEFFKEASDTLKVVALANSNLNLFSATSFFKNLSVSHKQKSIHAFLKSEASILLSLAKEYEGDWKELDRDGIPFFFKIIHTSDKSLLEYLTAHPEKFDFSLKTNPYNLNYLEYWVQNDSSIKLSSIERHLKLPQLKDSKILVQNCDLKLFCFRFQEEKASYSAVVQMDLLKDILSADLALALAEPKIIKALLDWETENQVCFLDYMSDRFVSNLTPEVLMTLKEAKLSINSRKLAEYVVDSNWYVMYPSNSQHVDFKFSRSKLNMFNFLVQENPHLMTAGRRFDELAQAIKIQQAENKKLKLVPSFNFTRMVKITADIIHREKELLLNAPDFITKHPKWNDEFKESFKHYPADFIQDLLTMTSFEDFTLKILGAKSGFALNQAKKYLITSKKINLPKIFWVSHLIKAGFNYDLVNTFLQNPRCEGPILATCLPLYLKTLKNHASEKSVLKLLNCKNNFIHAEFLADTLDYFKNFEIRGQHAALNSLIRDAGTLEDLHDNLIDYDSGHLNQKLFPLNQEELFDLDGLEFSNNLKVKIPKTSFDLIEAGKALHICVGNGSYAESVVDKEIFIILVTDLKDTPRYCIELASASIRTKPHIRQARGLYNKDMPYRPQRALLELLTEIHGTGLTAELA